MPETERAAPTADEVLLASVDLARGALLEVTPAETVGSMIGHVVEAEQVLTLHFASDLAGYPGWHWSVTVARVEGGEPTVLETELMPGESALLAPEWVPWSERLADYRAAQEAAAAAAEAAAADGAESGEAADAAVGDDVDHDDLDDDLDDDVDDEDDDDDVDDDLDDDDDDDDEDDDDLDDEAELDGAFGRGDDEFDGIDIDALDESSDDDAIDESAPDENDDESAPDHEERDREDQADEPSP
jgi:DUF3027 family protein